MTVAARTRSALVASSLVAALAASVLPTPVGAAGVDRAADGGRGSTGVDRAADPATARAARRVVLTLAPGIAPASASAALAADGLTIVSSIGEIGTVVADAGSAAGRDAAIARLEHDPRFAAAEPSQVYHATAVPNDPMLSSEWWLDAIDVRPWWDWPTPATPVTIAIVDTGVDLSSPDLAPVLLPGKNFITPGMQPQDDSTNGHGSHVAGIAAAATNNGVGMAGVAAGARILPAKVLDADGAGNDTDVAAGIVWAVDQGARVINLSMDGAPMDPCPSVMTDAVAYARSKGAVVVAASGNNGASVGCPARIPGVLAVGAVDKDGVVWQGSDRGPQLGLVAPGVAIVSVKPTDSGGYGTLTGTSMAAPMVSGAAAILAMAAPSLSESAIRAALVSTARDIGPAGRDDTYGAGIVDVGKALAAAAQPITGAAVSPAVLAADGSGTADAATLSFSVGVPVNASVAVERPDGTVVRQLSSGDLAVGPRTVAWDGRDDADVRVVDGDYRFAIRGTGPGGVPVEITVPVAVSFALVSARTTPSAISPNGDGKADATRTSFSLRAPSTVTVTVRDAAGATIRTLTSGQRAAGSFSVTWNGRRGASASSPVVPDGAYTIDVASRTTHGTWRIALPVAVSIHGVAVTGLAASPIYPVADGYRDTSAITFTQSGTASSTVYVYRTTSSTAVRALAQGRNAKGRVTGRWDGRDAAGRIVAAGTYRVRVRTVDAAGVVRWSGYASVLVSGKRLVQGVFTATLRGDQRDSRSFVTSTDLASIAPSTVLGGGIVLRSDSPDERAIAFWDFAHPAWTTVVSARVTLATRRTGTGDASVGTWGGAGAIDAIGWIPAAGGVVAVDFPAARVSPAAGSFVVAVEQDGPGSTDVGTVTVRIVYAVLR